ncbi:serine hydrolase domain-containing protein [Pseudonocardia sp. ICBG1034]|uniref:serine hydrolase domain-containing protein n=1 Tax=Pseudonocardia sp. ICBG1034 TaxID=2844381 RepID=UPI001CCA77C1|nr:serine hydrolase domain-containing protein [Pseudonocardia sp. ICBG1034]
MTITGAATDAVRGSVADGFEPVRDAFAALLAAEGAPLDAQVAARYRGRPVVDLWAGPETGPDSLQGIYSATKGVTHLLVALLVQQGVLDLDERVAHYWPEFATGGKQDLLLRELLAHQAGLVGTPEGFSVDELSDDHLVAERLGAQRPFWRPGTSSGYHALVESALTGEVVRRATSAEVGTLVRELLTGPLGLDLYLGLPAEAELRFLAPQPMIATPERLRELAAGAGSPDGLPGIAFNRRHPDGCEVWELPAHPVVRSRGPASLGGIGTARALATLYAAATAPVDGRPALLRPDTLAAFAQIQTAGFDLVLRQHKAWAVGFHASSEVYPMLAAGSFGHSGAGGQQALADPRNELSYAFLRRHFLVPSQADADHARLLTALLRSVRGSGAAA